MNFDWSLLTIWTATCKHRFASIEGWLLKLTRLFLWFFSYDLEVVVITEWISLSLCASTLTSAITFTSSFACLTVLSFFSFFLTTSCCAHVHSREVVVHAAVLHFLVGSSSQFCLTTENWLSGSLLLFHAKAFTWCSSSCRCSSSGKYHCTVSFGLLGLLCTAVSSLIEIREVISHDSLASAREGRLALAEVHTTAGTWCLSRASKACLRLSWGIRLLTKLCSKVPTSSWVILLVIFVLLGSLDLLPVNDLLLSIVDHNLIVIIRWISKVCSLVLC